MLANTIAQSICLAHAFLLTPGRTTLSRSQPAPPCNPLTPHLVHASSSLWAALLLVTA